MKKIIDNEFTSMNYKRTVYETSKADKAKVVTDFSDKGLPGAGVSCLLIGGTHQDGTKEVLELRFHSDFLPHIKLLIEGLEDLTENEKERTEEMLKAAESIVNGDSRPEPSSENEASDDSGES